MSRSTLSALVLAGVMPLALGLPGTVQAQGRGVAPRQPVTVAVKEITNNASGVWWWSPRVEATHRHAVERTQGNRQLHACRTRKPQDSAR